MIDLEINDQGEWRDIATVSLIGLQEEGTQAKCELAYNMDYVTDKIAKLQSRSAHALSCHYGVDFSIYETGQWPAFLG